MWTPLLVRYRRSASGALVLVSGSLDVIVGAGLGAADAMAAVLERIHGQDRARFESALASVHPRSPVEYRVRTTGGEWAWVFDHPLADGAANRERSALVLAPATAALDAVLSSARPLLEQVLEPLGVRSSSGALVWANAAYLERAGCSPATAGAADLELLSRPAGGCSPIYDPRGVELGAVELVTVASPSRSSEPGAFDSLAFLDSIIENIPDMIFLKEATDLRFVRFNRAGEALLGYRREELLGKNDFDFFPPEQARFFVEKDREVLRQGALVDIAEERINTRSRGVRVLHTKKIPLLGARGEPAFLLGISEDITERVRAEEELRRLHQALEERVAERTSELERANLEIAAVYETSPVGLACLDRELRFVRVNAALAALDGEEISAHLGRTIHEVLPADLCRELEPYARRVLAGELVRDVEVKAQAPGRPGDERVYAVTFSPIDDAAGQPWEVNLAVTDISERKRLTERLIEDDRRKDEFLAMLAHELRNPLAPISNAASLLHKVPDPGVAFAREIIERQIQHLARLVDDLLDASRVTRGKITLQRSMIPLSEVIDRSVEEASPAIAAHRHRLVVRVPGQPVRIYGDLTRLVQIVGNVLNNSAKFTEDGGTIVLAAEVEHPPGAPPTLVVSVRDDGIGIAPEMLPRIFELFTQAERSLERSRGGLGIGLGLVKQLVELHGGTVAARSAGLGLGTEVIVQLPLDPPRGVEVTERPVPLVMAAPARISRVLVVEDCVDAADSLAELLRDAEYEVEVAYDGRRALELAAGFRPEVVLCDIGLPEMNGLEVAKALRALEVTREAHLIALTGYGEARDRVAGDRAGFDRYLVKPIDFTELLGLLGRTSRPESGDAVSSAVDEHDRLP